MDYLGFLVENRVITSALFERMQQLPSVKLFSPMSVQHIELEGIGKRSIAFSTDIFSAPRPPRLTHACTS
jgi:2-polyprenyl-6-methoxyphenol hydroxylase-like FAD-dependent oxidoreductase